MSQMWLSLRGAPPESWVLSSTAPCRRWVPAAGHLEAVADVGADLLLLQGLHHPAGGEALVELWLLPHPFGQGGLAHQEEGP